MLHVALKDLRLIARDRSALVSLLIVPIVGAIGIAICTLAVSRRKRPASE